MTSLVYTPDQLKGWDLFAQFYMNPNENVMLLKGYSGTGKSTLVKMLIDRIPQLDEMRRLVDPNWQGMDVCLTATTNQAAVSLAQATNSETRTVHSQLGLTLITENYKTRKKKLIPKGNKVYDSLIIIDESSYVDQELLGLIFHQTERCKFLFVGDHAQLKPVGSNYMPVFDMNKNQIELTQLVRFDDGPISRMVSNLRDTVLTQTWHKFELATDIIEHVSRADFEMLAKRAFADEKTYGVSKILGFHNDVVVNYNQIMSDSILGSKELQVGQRVVSNSAVIQGKTRLNNNEELVVESLMPAKEMGYEGQYVQLVGKQGLFFQPAKREYVNAAHRFAAEGDDYEAMKAIDEQWVDLRPTFSCTVNKSQGSTYGTSFVDLSDISRGAKTADQLARYLYVGNSRCRQRCIMTGDIV